MLTLFPIPPPFPWFVQISGGRRVSKQRRALHAKRVLTNVMCCALSHLHLGFATEAPPRGRSGQHLGAEQLAFVEECMSRVNRFCRLLNDGARQTLTNAKDLLSEMMRSLVSLEVVSYCRPRSSGAVFTRSTVGRPSSGPGRHDLAANMIGFPDKLIPFDPRPYLCADSVKAYDDPSSLTIAEDLWGEPPATFSAPIEELVLLACRWDAVDRLAVFPASGPEAPVPDELCSLFCLMKPGTDLPELRQIIDRRGRNRKERGLHTGSRMLPLASQSLDLYIAPHQFAYFSSNDLRHMYLAFAGVS